MGSSWGDAHGFGWLWEGLAQHLGGYVPEACQNPDLGLGWFFLIALLYLRQREMVVNVLFLLNVSLALKCGKLCQVSFFTFLFFLPITV